MKISIIVPAFNEERVLAETLARIRQAAAALEQRGWTVETIVCDNNSSDRTAAIARAGGVRVVFEPVNQISRARNRGASAADGDWLIFVDADSHPSAGLFGEMAERIDRGDCLAGGAEIRMITARRIGRFFSQLWNWISRWGRWPAGSFIFVKAEAFRDIGGFSEALFVAEEVELARHLKRLARRQGRKLVILRKHPIETSGRKVELYSTREMGWFFLRAFFAGRRVLENRKACHPWYDGRR